MKYRLVFSATFNDKRTLFCLTGNIEKFGRFLFTLRIEKKDKINAQTHALTKIKKKQTARLELTELKCILHIITTTANMKS